MKVLAFGITAAALAAAGVAFGATPACKPDPRLDQVVSDWFARRPQPLRYYEAGQGTCFRQAFIARLQQRLGPVIGYKVGAYTKAAQAQYKTDRPALAVLLKGMMLPEGRPVPADFGATPLWEADFLMVIRDDGINTAKTREEAYRHIRGYRPFIELPDRGYPASAALTLDQWKALDISARAGIMGKEVPLPHTPEALARLGALTVDAEQAGPSGTQTRSAVGRESLGDPVDIVLAARDMALEEGKRLKAGDVISLGTFIPATPVKAGEKVTVRYHIFDKPDVISVQFR